MALLFGVHEDADPAQTVARVGGNATRVFTPGIIGARDLVKAATAVCTPSWNAGVTAVWSFKPDPAQVASRAWKPYVTDLGAFLRDRPQNKTVVVVWHEPENDLDRLGSAAGFVRMFDTVAGWLRAAHPGVTTCHAALGYRYGDGRDITDRVAPTWRTSADLHCIDVYSGRSNPIDTILPELSSYRRWRRYVAQGSRWGVTERGWTIGTIGKGGTSVQRSAAMAREAAWLAGLPTAQQPEVYLLWSTGGTENDRGLIFDAGAEQAARTITGHYARRAAAEASPTPAPEGPAAQAAPVPPATPAPTPAGNTADQPAPAPSLPAPAAPAPTPPAPAAPTGSVADRALAYINTARAGAGQPPLSMDAGLLQAAAVHNRVMADSGELTHRAAGEPALGERLTDAGVRWRQIAENIGYASCRAGDDALTQAANGLTDRMLAETPPEDGHRRNLLNPALTRVGIAVHRDPRGTAWVTHDFAN